MSAVPAIRCADVSLEPSGLLIIVYNRTETLNSMSDEVYREMALILNWAAKAAQVKAVLISAKGRVFSSGRDLSHDAIDDILSGKRFPNIHEVPARYFIAALIDFPKLLVAGVNGPAYGIGVTTLALFDVVYASPSVKFCTPFSALGLSAEGCSTHTFPQIMGPGLAARMLYLAETVPAQEFVPSGFVTQIIDSPNFLETVIDMVQTKITTLSYESIIQTKSHIRSEAYRKQLHEICLEELKTLKENANNEFLMETMRKKKQALLKKENRRQSKL